MQVVLPLLVRVREDGVRSAQLLELVGGLLVAGVLVGVVLKQENLTTLGLFVTTLKRLNILCSFVYIFMSMLSVLPSWPVSGRHA